MNKNCIIFAFDLLKQRQINHFSWGTAPLTGGDGARPRVQSSLTLDNFRKFVNTVCICIISRQN